jgi:hypothetical protein
VGGPDRSAHPSRRADLAGTRRLDATTRGPYVFVDFDVPPREVGMDRTPPSPIAAAFTTSRFVT